MFDKTKKYWCLVDKKNYMPFVPGLYFVNSNVNKEWQLCDVLVNADDFYTQVTFKPINDNYASRNYDIKSLAQALENGAVVESTGSNGPTFIKYDIPITSTVSYVESGYVIA